tara:strand:- start:3329 stop:4018 length:690 start_codon:yes stop_codon:yes gene_type:complete
MLFLEDAYLKECETVAVKIENNGIILKDTVFYAKSGGQPGDNGRLLINNNEITVIDTVYNPEKNITHVCENISNIKIGDKITAKIDWNQRFIHMRMHSALHLLCSLVPYGVTGGQISKEKSRLDFNAEDKMDRGKIEDEINKLVEQDHEISYQWITNEELDQKPELVRTMSVKPPKTNNKIRLVKIGSIDLQPCGGTHVKSTKEIGPIKISKIENKGKMNKRVNLVLND